MFRFAQNALFVAGTDTNVGKTVVTALLALAIRQSGRSCGVFKPFASGCELRNGVLVSDDARFLRQTLNLSDSMDEICPIRLQEPLAPLIAARRAGTSTQGWPQIARDGLENLRARYDCVLVEGAGGILAPLWEDARGIGSNRELIRDLDLSAVLVARRTLGTINHTLLALEAAPFCGIVFNDAVRVADDDAAAQTSPGFIAAQTAAPVWGEIGFLTDLEVETLRGKMESLWPKSG